MQFSLEQPKFLKEAEHSLGISDKSAVAPMPGVLDRILVKAGDFVKKGDTLAVLIAMKMEFLVKASKDGKITKVNYEVGKNVQKGAVLVQFEENS